MRQTIKSLLTASLLLSIMPIHAQTVDYSVVSVGEEAGLNFKQITNDSDYVEMPSVKRFAGKVSWDPRKVLAIFSEGGRLAFLSNRNNTTNIFIKNMNGAGTTIQRTKRSRIIDFALSPDEKNFVFTERNGNSTRIFITDANEGYICRQVTDGENDSYPSYSYDMSKILFGRVEGRHNSGIWSYNLKDNSLSNITTGYSPVPLKGTNEIVCVRQAKNGRAEIWKINCDSGVEECIVSSTERNFSSPSISPDGEWLLMVGDNSLTTSNRTTYSNTDIFVCRLNGADLTQLTYHAADDLSPVWSPDGRFIYFVSKRGSNTGTANVWRIPFKIK